jgi:hypothetical protein
MLALVSVPGIELYRIKIGILNAFPQNLADQDCKMSLAFENY